MSAHKPTWEQQTLDLDDGRPAVDMGAPIHARHDQAVRMVTRTLARHHGDRWPTTEHLRAALADWLRATDIDAALATMVATRQVMCRPDGSTNRWMLRDDIDPAEGA